MFQEMSIARNVFIGREPVKFGLRSLSVLNEEKMNVESMSAIKEHSFNLVITVCDNAKESCPVLMGIHKKLHWCFEDPVGLNKHKFCEVRELIYQKFKSELGAYF